MGAGGRRAVRRRRHPHPLSHPFTEAVRGVLPRPAPARSAAYLALLDRRLAALARRASGQPVSDESLGLADADRALAAGFLQSIHGRWHDGDENLVRGYLDRWARPGEDAGAAAAGALVAAAEALPAMGAPPAALWFYLWEMESMLESARRV